MLVFEVNDMSCGHCVGRITAAIQAVDAAAQVRADLPQHRVEVDAPTAGVPALEQAIRAAGYTPKLLAGAG